MNALDMSFQKVRKTLMHLVPPPPPPRHPNLRELRHSVLDAIKCFEGVSESLSGFSPLSFYADDGSLKLPEDRFRDLAGVAEALFIKLEKRAWAPTQVAADMHFPSLGPRLRDAVANARLAVRNLALDIDFMVDTGFARRAGIDTGPVKVESLSERPRPPALSDEEYAALVVQAESRARLEDGTVDPGLFALELSELLPVDPDPPRSDDAHARFHGDVRTRRALFRNG